ncbi:MAG: hypothetical protein A2958_03055 [Candidatus Levybacteria bacterium RIFCSPLOWO2_01_FULL_38_13]|nr:MAG: hypothetical protein A2629_03470 [Candidatus Levybacteria bacterium RIFCSPHIGHO2_01_FULL_41_15]OGH35302.1 MAG: hypothetical protein A2958_03055 [Candidatus Levybacteria bacterium RIFCSPLOWO2_01_FULL_38_13]
MKNFRKWVDFAIQFVKIHKIISFVILLALIVILFVFKPGEQTPVATEKVRKENISQTISITGSVDSSNTVNLSFRVSGKLVYLGVKKGDYVYANQTIGALDERTVQKNLEIALIDYSKQRLTFDQTKENNQNRTIEGALNESMRRILQNNQYDLDKSVKSVELADLAREESALITPISGVITKADAETQGINISTTTTFMVTDLNSLNFEMDVDQADIGKVKVGQSVRVVLDSYPDETLALTIDGIDYVSHTTSTGGDAFTVSAKIPIPPDYKDYKYRVGMNGNAEIIISEKNNVLSVPLSAIEDDNVYVKTESGFSQKKVKLGLQSDTRAEITEGLSENDTIASDISSIPKQGDLRIPFLRRFLRR